MMAASERTFFIFGCSLLVAVAASCRRSEVEIVHVEGTITSEGGDWPAAGMLFFTPVEPAVGFPARPGWAQFDRQGRFRVTTLREGDGLIPGKYWVGVEALASPWEMGQPRPASTVPDKFESPATSGLEVSVTSGQRKIMLNWNVPKP